MRTINTDTAIVGPWVMARLASVWVPGSGYALGLEENGEIIAGVVFEGWNEASLRMHVAAIPGAHWLNREFLFTCFHYPFLQLGCSAVLATVADSNEASKRFVTGLGFSLRATLEDCHPDGALLIYVMYKPDCKWLSFRGFQHGETERSTSA